MELVEKFDIWAEI